MLVLSVQTRLKNTDKAIEMLGKAIDEGYVNRASFETDYRSCVLRNDERFKALLERLPKQGN
ncbi:MAG TPA: hypothetical protein VFZ23_06715 [Pyrinomonadaceae bacterium]